MHELEQILRAHLEKVLYSEICVAWENKLKEMEKELDVGDRAPIHVYASRMVELTAKQEHPQDAFDQLIDVMVDMWEKQQTGS